MTPFGHRLEAFLIVVLLFCFVPAAIASEEEAAFSKFQQLAQAADAKLAIQDFKTTHSNPAAKQDLEQFEKMLTQKAISVLDEGTEFSTRFPGSSHLAEIQNTEIEALYISFGAMGFPMPPSRLADIEACAKKGTTPDDFRPAMILVRTAAALPPDQQQTLLEYLSHDQTPEPARTMAKEALKKLKHLGHPLELKFTALDGRTIDLAAYKGKVVLIDFWSTTCVPCVRELPDLKKLYEKHQAEGLEVIGVTLDQDQTVLKRFVEKEKLPWPQYFAPPGTTNSLENIFAIHAIPVVWLVDRQGILRHLNGREGQEEKIVALLKEHQP